MSRPRKCKKCKKPKQPKGKKSIQIAYCTCGRRKIIDEIVLRKLEDAFSNGCSDREACVYAGIGLQTLYDYQRKNPKFSERKAGLKLHPNIGARATIARALNSKMDVSTAKWWLEKKDKEFTPKTKQEIVQKDDAEEIEGQMSEEEMEALSQFRKARRKRIEAESDKLE